MSKNHLAMPSGRKVRDTSRRGSLRLALGGVLGAAALLRLAHWWAVRDAPFVAWPVMDSLEYHRWAMALASGDWWGSEAYFQAPLYPYLLGALYTALGARVTVAYLFQIAIAVLAVGATYRSGRLLAGPALGLTAAALVAASGVLVFLDVQLLKESLATSSLALLLWAALAAARSQGAFSWGLTGALLGVLCGLRENALLLLPLAIALPWVGAPASRRRRAAGAVALLAGTLLALLPSLVRNRLVAGEWLLTTYQGGVNFYIGNHPGADGTYRPLVPGKQVPALERSEPVRLAEAAMGRPLSAREVSRYWLRRSLEWAAEEPVAFLRLQIRKLGLFWRFYEQPDAVDYYWIRQRSPALRLAFVELGALALLAVAGLWWVRHQPRRWAPVLGLTAGWMVSTVVFFVFSRYRAPVIPPLALLAAVPLTRLWERLRGGDLRTAAPLTGVLIAVFALPHLLAPGPRLDLVHYNLGRLAEERGQPDQAAAHYRQALAAGSEDFLPHMNLGNLAARGGEPRRALDHYRRALEWETGSDDLWANLGAAHLALGELPEATQALARALALNPTHLQAQHSFALLREREGRLEEARRWNQRVLARDPDHPAARRLAARLSAAPPRAGRSR